MKPFDLEAALNGAPVETREGKKAFVLADLRKYLQGKKTNYPLYCVTHDGSTRWHCGANGLTYVDSTHSWGIVGMWEEPPKMVRIAGMEFPAPETEAPQENTTYYALTVHDKVQSYNWAFDDFDKLKLQAGGVWLDPKHAEQAAEVLRKIRKGEF